MRTSTESFCLVSIIIPTYNRKGLVPSAIDSALLFGKGIDGGFEVIVVDDCSGDGTFHMLQDHYSGELNAGMIRLVSTPENLGVTGARNLGAAEAGGRWFLFLDSDDLLIPDAAQAMTLLLRHLTGRPLVIFRCVHLETGELIGPSVSSSYDLTLRDLLNRGTPGECLPVVRSDVFARFPYDTDLRGCEGLAYARMIKALGPARVETLAVRRYRTANRDRLSSVGGRLNRSCQIAEYYRRVLLNDFRALSAMTALEMVMKLLWFRCHCMIRRLSEHRKSFRKFNTVQTSQGRRDISSWRMAGRRFMRRPLPTLVSAFVDTPLNPVTRRDEEFIEALRARFPSLPQSNDRNRPRSEAVWSKNAERLKWLVFHKDPRNFLRWDVVLRTMCVVNDGFVHRELRFLRTLPDWEERWEPAIEENSTGHPIPYWRYPRSSGNRIHHGYHCARFEAATGMRVDQFGMVVEFGGGYGSMCHLIHRLGFNGKYIIFDLPAFSALQMYYLSSTGLPLTAPESFSRAKRRAILCVSDLAQLRRVLSDGATPASRIFISTWALSEAPIAIRERILPLVSTFDGFLIGYQDRFEDEDNHSFFHEWAGVCHDIRWLNWEISHLPHNYYLVGRRDDLQKER